MWRLTLFFNGMRGIIVQSMYILFSRILFPCYFRLVIIMQSDKFGIRVSVITCELMYMLCACLCRRYHHFLVRFHTFSRAKKNFVAWFPVQLTRYWHQVISWDWLVLVWFTNYVWLVLFEDIKAQMCACLILIMLNNFF